MVKLSVDIRVKTHGSRLVRGIAACLQSGTGGVMKGYCLVRKIICGGQP